MKPGDGSRAVDVVKPGLSGLKELLLRCGIDMSAFQLELLWRYHRFLRGHNQELNLTRIHNFTSMVHKHYVDSMLPALLMDLPTPLLDMGSGAGFPGIPLKILRPDLKIILAESRGKRVDFLQSAVDELGLEGVQVIGRKVTPRFRYPVSAVISRAVLSISDTLEAVKGSLGEGGLAVLMKGPGCNEELEEAEKRFGSEFELFMDRAYSIPETTHRRRLVVFRRKGVSRPATQAGPARRVRMVESGENPVFKSLKKMCDSRGVKKSGSALVSGEKLVRELIEKNPGICQAWIGSAEGEPPPPGLSPDVEWLQLSPDLFRLLDIFGTGFPILRAAVPACAKWVPEEGFPDGCSLVLPFQDPENVGAAIRSAAAFGVSQVILTTESAHPFHPKAIRASGGAVFSVPLRAGVSITELTGELPLVVLSAGGQDITEFRFPDAFGLLAGIEGPGLPGILKKNTVGIPMSRDIESLNAAVSLSVALYEWYRRRPGLDHAVGSGRR